MRRRTVYTIGAMALTLALLGSTKFFQVRAAIAQYASFAPPPEAVTTATAEVATWPETLDAVASVVPVQGVTVSADLPGVVAKIAFESGSRVGKGALLVELDTSQERAQLAAAEAEQQLAQTNVDRERPLHAKGVVAKSDLDKMEAELLRAQARVAEIRATIERKTIRAPFGGQLGIRQVNLGQYLEAGSPIVPLQTLDPIYVNFAVPQQEVGRLRQGARVTLSGDGIETAGQSGRITAIDSVVDVDTRNVQVQARFDNPDGRLRPGMFVTAHLQVGQGSPAISLPASAISYAPYGDSVYVVEPMQDPKGATYTGVRQQVVKLGPSRGDQVTVLSGLEPGTQVVTSGVFKLRPGAAVLVDNTVKPSDEIAPAPENS